MIVFVNKINILHSRAVPKGKIATQPDKGSRAVPVGGKCREKEIIMDELEKVERLRERADVSYEEAKKALEECGGDLLDAMVYLEKQGKVKKPKRESFTTQYEEPEKIQEAADNAKNTSGIGDMLNRFFEWCRKLIQKGNETMFKVERNDKNIICIPVTVFVIICLFFFWAVFFIMVIGLFFGCRYSFEGIGKVNLDVNKAMDNAADAAEKIKNEFTDKQ